jgi:hypothetical protein
MGESKRYDLVDIGLELEITVSSWMIPSLVGKLSSTKNIRLKRQSFVQHREFCNVPSKGAILTEKVQLCHLSRRVL